MISLYDNFKNFFLPASPVIYTTIIILSIFRVIYLRSRKRNFIIHKEIINFLSLFYLLCLFHFVTARDINVYGTSNYIPFQEMTRYKTLSPLFIRNVVGNVVLFTPYGYLICKYLKSKKFLLNFVLVVFASLAIEITQLSIGRVFDIDDIILNVIGGIIGYIIFLIFNKMYVRLPKFLKKPWLLNVIAIIIFITFIGFIISLYL